MVKAAQYSALSSLPASSKASAADTLRVSQYAMTPDSSRPVWYATQSSMAAQRAGHSASSVIKSAEMMEEPKTHPISGSPVTQPVGVAGGSEEVGDGSVDVGSPVGSSVGSESEGLGTVMVSKVVVPPAVT